jgi:hypothetical protein
VQSAIRRDSCLGKVCFFQGEIVAYEVVNRYNVI